MRVTFNRLRARANQLPEQEVSEAFGSREELDEILRAATSEDADEATRGVVQLWYGSAHQSALFPVATHMPDILVELLDDGPAAVQVQVLMGLAKHAEPHCYHLGYPGLLPQVFEFGQESASREGAHELTDYERICLRTWEAVGRHVDRYVTLLNAEQAEVMAAALYLLSLLKEWREGTQDTIRSLAYESAAGERRASACMALGLHAWSTGEGREVLLPPKESTPASELGVRVAQAIAAAHNHIADDHTLLDTLAAGSRLPRLVFDRFPWCAGAIAGPAAEAMTRLSPDLEADVVEALIGALLHHHREGQETCDEEDWEWPVPELVSEHLVRFAFARFLGRTDEVTIEELTPTQRRILVVLFEVGCHPAALTHAGVRRLSRRMVGLDPPGPLDRPLTFSGPAGLRSWPIWKWWWLALRGEISEDDLAQELGRTYQPQELADIAIDMTRGDYDIMSRTPHHPVPLAQRLMDSVAPEVEPYLLGQANRLLHDNSATISEIAVIMFGLLNAWHSRGMPIDWKYEPLLRRLARQSKSIRDEVARLVPKHERSRLK